MGSSFECLGVVRELILVKVFSDFVGTRPHFWIFGLWPFFFVQQKVVPLKLLFYVYILIRRGGVLDLIEFQLHSLTHRQKDCAFIYNILVLY